MTTYSSGRVFKSPQPEPEVPGSLVPERKLRDSRFKSRLGTGLGINIRAM